MCCYFCSLCFPPASHVQTATHVQSSPAGSLCHKPVFILSTKVLCYFPIHPNVLKVQLIPKSIFFCWYQCLIVLSICLFIIYLSYLSKIRFYLQKQNKKHVVKFPVQVKTSRCTLIWIGHWIWPKPFLDASLYFWRQQSRCCGV